MPTVYDIITEQIVKHLDAGVVPWRKTWKGGAPCNFITRRQYSGINAMLLGFADYEYPYWLTLKQCNTLGGKVKKGEKSWIVTFCQTIEKERTKEQSADGKKPNGFFLMRYYRVFNICQCEGLTMPEEAKKNDPLTECENIVNNFSDKPTIEHGGARACYSPMQDIVRMPPRNTFDNSEYYYSVLFHELGHSTGHEKRLKRDTVITAAPFGSAVYSKEELIAEFTSAFLCGVAGIAPAIVENAASYIQGWREALSQDKKLLISAAGKAQRAANYIRGIKEQFVKKQVETE